MPVNGVLLPGLKEARLRAAMTQEELATQAKVARSTVARMETGALEAPATIRKLAAVLGVRPDALMGPAQGQPGQGRASKALAPAA